MRFYTAQQVIIRALQAGMLYAVRVQSQQVLCTLIACCMALDVPSSEHAPQP